MITYTWNKDRELIKSSSTPLHRGDTNVGKLNFIIPTTIEDVDITTLPLYIRYTLPNGDTYVKQIEEIDSEFDKDGFVKYILPITPTMTSVSGRVEFDLRFDNVTEDIESDKPSDNKPSDDGPGLADDDDLNDIWGSGATTFDLTDLDDESNTDVEDPEEVEPDEDEEKELEIRIYSNMAYYNVTPNSNFYVLKEEK